MVKLNEAQLIAGLKKLNAVYPLFLPVQENQAILCRRIEKNAWSPETWAVTPYRSAFPLKNLFYPPVQKTATYPDPYSAEVAVAPMVIIGAKACDLRALEIIDKVYAEGDFPEPYYTEARKSHIIISADCMEANSHCFCTLMHGLPYPTGNYDLNLSKINNDYLVEIGSEKGKELLDTYFSGGQTASPEELNLRNEQREIVKSKVDTANKQFTYFQTHQAAVEKHLNSDIWKDLSKTCVECGICTQICPTCHCFLLYDQPAGEQYERIKVWDSCFFAGYSRMAGGLTPRLRLEDRFKNRFYHKFDSFVTNFNMEACTGCGRCVEGCMGNIDLREVLMELEKRVVLKENFDLL